MQSQVAKHEFNEHWLGINFAISSDPMLLRMNQGQLDSLLSSFDICELRIPSQPLFGFSPSFQYSDTQVRYQLPLVRWKHAQDNTRLNRVSTAPITSPHFQDWAGFGLERYAVLKGMTPQVLQCRYELWASTLLETEPGLCRQVFHDSESIGWFFGKDRGSEVEFALAVRDKTSSRPGLELYACAMNYFFTRGYSRVSSNFSARNVGALSIHAELGCRFISSQDTFFWQRAGC